MLSEITAPDWIVRLDGQPMDSFITDATLRGLYVPWGTHTIEFEYQPGRVYAGVAISLLSLVACVGALSVKRMRWKRNE